jgi:predicted RNA-binding Zn-ribbon protein involved in translation (DUF1610 family)
MRSPKAVIASAAIFAILFAGVTLWIGSNAKSATENALASVFLALISIAASWILAHYYYLSAKENEIDKITELHNANLRTYALKAAEKVTNLSSELARLSSYLRDYLQNDHNEDSLDVVLNTRDERIYGAVHIVEMLRSVNDTSLSDWKGVIGDELDKKREEDEEKEIQREERLGEIAQKINLLLENRQGATDNDVEKNVLFAMQQMRKELETVLASNNTNPRQPPFSSTAPADERPRFFAACPQCGNAIRINVSKRGKVHTKTYACGLCGTKLVSGQDEHNNPMLDFRVEKQENVKCPSCGREHVVLIENVPGVSVLRECNSCSERFKVNRTPKNALTVTSLGRASTQDLNPDIIATVRGLLPIQPWPKGTATEIASKLGISRGVVKSAITHLMHIGVFRYQVDGQLYDTGEEANAARSIAQR